MPDTSPALSLPYLLPSQAQKHVTHNEALERLDVVTQLTVTALSETAPPAVPQDGDSYIPAAGASGGWAGQAGRIARYADSSWHFIDPRAGWRALDLETGLLHVFDGASWAPLAPASQNLEGVGIGTSWDALNRLSVAAGASLFSHAGAGHQVKINKASDTETASILFQSDWAGHAEIGLAGNNDLAVKTSADGVAWSTALQLAADSGHLGLGTGTPQHALHAVTSGAPAIAVESDGYGTADLIARGRRNSNNTDVARLRFINQEDSPGTDAAEAGIIASRRSGVGDIQMKFMVADAGTPVEAFSILPSGSLSALQIFSAEDHLTLNTFGPDSARLVANRTLTLAADPDASQSPARSEIRFETDGAQQAVLNAQGGLGLGISSPARRLHVSEAMRLEPGPEPSSPVAGDLYFDAATARLRCHDGTQWHDLF